MVMCCGIMILGNLSGCNAMKTKETEYHWPTSTLVKSLPVPESKYGEIVLDAEDSFEIDIENAYSGKRDYYATILEYDGKSFELAEHYYQEVKDENKDCQINIFGYFKTIGGALRNLSKFGNTTMDGRKPKEIYI